MKRYFLPAIICIVCIGWGCTPESPSFSALFKSFDRQGMLTNLGNNIVIPAYNELKVDVQALRLGLQDLKNSPDALKMSAAQTQWKELNNSWRACEVYGFGPLDYQLAKLKIDNYSCNITNINNHIGSGSTFTQEYINLQPASDKGLVTLEYLLFGNGPDPLSLFQADTQRINYALAVATNLETLMNNVQHEWVSSGNNYVQTFIINDGNNVSSSLGKIMNYLVMFADEIKNMKLGKPMGKLDGHTIPDAVESYYSGQSLENITQNLQALEKLFTGDNQPGMNALLDHLGVKDHNGLLLSEKLNAKFAEIYTKIANVSGPLSQAVDADAADCEALYTAVGELYILLKVDAMNQLGLLLTFTDNDGD